MRTGYLQVQLVCLSLGICLLLQVQHAHAKENKTDPTDNVNLSPFQAWRSAYYCLLKTAPAHCKAFEKVSLTDKGLLEVFPSNIEEYCTTSGCAQHVFDVLKCIHLCKRDFWFANNATVSVLNQTIHDGCSNKTQSISTLSWKKSSGMKVQQKMYIPFVASISTMAFIVIFKM